MESSEKEISELTINLAVIRLFRRIGITRYIREAQFCERYIDFIGEDNNHVIHAVESKVNSVKRAFSQALRYRHTADYVYVAVLENGSNRTATRLSCETGVGLIFVGRDSMNRFRARLAIPPQRSGMKDEKIAQYVWSLNSNRVWEN
jgi:hypothetical protein